MSWKDNIITDEPENETDFPEELTNQPTFKKTIKADILELIEEHDVYDFRTISRNIDHGDWLVKDCLDELRDEEILEVRNS